MLTKRMAMRRMNEMWRRMALTLLFCGLLFHTCQGQETSTVITGQTSVTSQPGSTQSSPEDTTDTSTTDAPDSSAPEEMRTTTHSVIATQDTSPRSQKYATTKDAAQTHEELATSKAVTTNDMVYTTEKMDKSSTYQSENSLNSKILNEISNEKTGHESGQPMVFVPILVSGLILAAALIGLYVWKNHCHRKTTGMKLAEESYMGDDANQGNTLVSVAPLNPPESQEKPSQNGESLEAVKTQNPPAATNGHSTTKADTEL